MVSKEVVVTNASGLHARPAVRFVSTAKKFQSKLTVKYEGKEINGRSIASVLSAGIVAGSRIVLQFDGEDECEALEALVAEVVAGLGE